MDLTRVSSPAKSLHSHTLPSIHVYDSASRHYSRSSSQYSPYASARPSISSGPMSIPNARESAVPPPLPPPKHIEGLDRVGGSGLDLGWRWGNTDHGAFGGISNTNPVNPSSSLHGRHAQYEQSDDEDRQTNGRSSPELSTRRTPMETTLPGLQHIDEGYASLSGSSIANYKLQAEDSIRNDFMRSSVQAYDSSVLRKLDSARPDPTRRNPDSPPRNFQPLSFSSTLSEASLTSTLPFRQRQSAPLKPLSMPLHNGTASPSSISSISSNHRLLRWANMPDSAVSPRHKPAEYSPQNYMEYRNSMRENGSISSVATDSDHASLNFRSPLGRAGSGSLLGSFDDGPGFANRATRASYDTQLYADPESDLPAEEAGMRHLDLRDRTPPRGEGYSPRSRAGRKRRASSPPRESDMSMPMGAAGNMGDVFGQIGPSRLSAERKASVPRLNHGSVSSTSSTQRDGSYASSTCGLSLVASSTTSVSSSDRISPSALSPAAEQDHTRDSVYQPSPRGSISRTHPRASSESRTPPATRKSSLDGSLLTKPSQSTKLQGILMCECCPKKPRKFETLEDLRLHESEKQYTCQYCNNRFKNKNEAERHQNSLHLRRHSWSCAAISGVEAAFHSSPQRPLQADVCGYCGDEFPIPVDLAARVEHLTMVHKFGECNHAKKFFRADHFRQHLKHSHAGTSGKWTNMLENACMKDEPLPIPVRVGSINDGVGRIVEEREED